MKMLLMMLKNDVDENGDDNDGDYDVDGNVDDDDDEDYDVDENVDDDGGVGGLIIGFILYDAAFNS